MEDDELRLYDMDNKIFMKVTRQRNRLYKANLRIGIPVCLLANLKDDIWLWHAILGHLNLKSMAQRDLVHGIPTIKHTTQVCDVCLIGKHNRAPFPKKAKGRSTSPLDLVYGDLCGPITPPTPSGKKYIFFRDVKFKENETWDWKEYMSEHINNEPEWTDFKIENLEVTREHHDQGDQPIKEENEFPNNDNDGYESPTMSSPSHSQTPHTPSTTANNKWEVHHLDVKSAFLHEDLKEEVQVPRAWNIKLDNTLKSLDFKKCALEQAIFTKTSRDSTLLIGVYVDDLIITGTPKKEIDKFKDQMEEKFKMSDLGLLAYYLGIEVTQTGGDISIKQTAYANKILKEAGMIDCNETRLTKITEGTMVNSTEYRSLIGCLRYLLHTRPDSSYSVGLLSRFMQEPREQHMKAIRQVLRYVKGTKDYGITYKHNGGNKIQGFNDSSYGVNTQEGKGTTGIIFYYGESPISWSTQKQATVALSSCESEFIAATAATTQALWLKRLLSKLTHSQEEKVTIMVDNKSAIALMKNPVFH
ncbi:ribonuclease H-like domain, reverse transcriptase, RNA-dependent DNA polymerase [Tanacetum coccineum]